MKRSESGAIQTSALAAIVMTFLFVGSLIFGLAMLMGKSDLQKNLDAKVEAQVGSAVKKAEAAKDTELAEKEKSPVKTYTTPSALGSVSIDYPKTYSGYIDESSSSSASVSAYFHPNVVPKEDRNTTFALRMQVLPNSYDSQVRTFDTNVKGGKLTVKAFRAAKVPSVLGTRIDGEIATGKQGSIILLPLRDKTIKIWTESKDFMPDFDKYVVPSITFIP